MTLSKNINHTSSLVLVQPRKNRPFITERLLMGRKESNQTDRKCYKIPLGGFRYWPLDYWPEVSMLVLGRYMLVVYRSGECI